MNSPKINDIKVEYGYEKKKLTDKITNNYKKTIRFNKNKKSG